VRTIHGIGEGLRGRATHRGELGIGVAQLIRVASERRACRTGPEANADDHRARRNV
jgi:hypothetical protein